MADRVQCLKIKPVSHSGDINLFKFCARNPNYPLQVEQVLNTDKEAKRFKMVKWEAFDTKKKYLEIGKLTS